MSCAVFTTRLWTQKITFKNIETIFFTCFKQKKTKFIVLKKSVSISTVNSFLKQLICLFNNLKINVFFRSLTESAVNFRKPFLSLNFAQPYVSLTWKPFRVKNICQVTYRGYPIKQRFYKRQHQMLY